MVDPEHLFNLGSLSFSSDKQKLQDNVTPAALVFCIASQQRTRFQNRIAEACSLRCVLLQLKSVLGGKPYIHKFLLQYHISFPASK